MPRVMGILNVTPDSFSDGGNFLAVDNALAHARRMVADGASIVDVGGESTRPGAASVSIAEEIGRVVPVIETLCAELPVIISVDTSRPDVMAAAVAAGAGMINDVRALQNDDALAAAADSGAAVCLMHMQGDPRTMQNDPQYGDVVGDVLAFLKHRVAVCVDAGIARDRLVIDPGFGFGKTLAHNLQLLKRLELFHELQLPILVGMSRKSMIGSVLDKEVGDRLVGGIACAVLALWQGASVIRTHDVRETVEAVRMCHAVVAGGF